MSRHNSNRRKISRAMKGCTNFSQLSPLQKLGRISFFSFDLIELANTKFKLLRIAFPSDYLKLILILQSKFFRKNVQLFFCLCNFVNTFHSKISCHLSKQIGLSVCTIVLLLEDASSKQLWNRRLIATPINQNGWNGFCFPSSGTIISRATSRQNLRI